MPPLPSLDLGSTQWNPTPATRQAPPQTPPDPLPTCRPQQVQARQLRLVARQQQLVLLLARRQALLQVPDRRLEQGDAARVPGAWPPGPRLQAGQLGLPLCQLILGRGWWEGGREGGRASWVVNRVWRAQRGAGWRLQQVSGTIRALHGPIDTPLPSPHHMPDAPPPPPPPPPPQLLPARHPPAGWPPAPAPPPAPAALQWPRAWPPCSRAGTPATRPCAAQTAAGRGEGGRVSFLGLGRTGALGAPTAVSSADCGGDGQHHPASCLHVLCPPPASTHLLEDAVHFYVGVAHRLQVLRPLGGCTACSTQRQQGPATLCCCGTGRRQQLPRTTNIPSPSPL
jgi:hypothetical protein